MLTQRPPALAMTWCWGRCPVQRPAISALGKKQYNAQCSTCCVLLQAGAGKLVSIALRGEEKAFTLWEIDMALQGLDMLLWPQVKTFKQTGGALVARPFPGWGSTPLRAVSAGSLSLPWLYTVQLPA